MGLSENNDVLFLQEVAGTDAANTTSSILIPYAVITERAELQMGIFYMVIINKVRNLFYL